MSTPAPYGAPSTDPQVSDWATNDEGASDERALIQAARAALKAQTGVQMRHVKIKRIFDFWQAQARAEAGFVEWLLDYADPTGEHATNNVLRQYAKELAA